MSGGDERTRAVVALLRQLWLGLSTYRLFPGDATRPSFLAAAERVRAAAETAIGTGPVEVGVRGSLFLLDGEQLPDDETMAKLALACFERRVELLGVHAPPGPEDLVALYGVLTMPPEELRESGGAAEMLFGSGVTAVALAAVGPAPVAGADHVPEDLEERPADPSRVPDASVLASELMIEDLQGSPEDQARSLLARLRSFTTGLALEPGRGIDFQAAVHDVITQLPDPIRHALVEQLVDTVKDDPVAERLIGTMSNAELTRALVDLGRAGDRDPVALARQLAEAGVRHLDLVDLTTALQRGQEEAGTILAGLEQLGLDVSETGGERAGSVGEVLAGYLAATKADDVRTLRAGVPQTERQRREAAILALRDYIVVETDLEQIGEALHVWSERVQRAVRERDVELVSAMVQPMREALASPAGVERASLFEFSVKRALGREVVLDLASWAEGPEGADPRPLLEPFGEAGVEALLDLLADEEDRDRRAHLLGLLRRGVHGHVGPVVARLRDPRWFVVRNAANLLGAAGGPDVLEQLGATTRHEVPEVRREAVKALMVAGGSAAVPHLQRAALEGPEDVRHAAIVALGSV
ncbi:MAG: HEAT repeat domain-containing protein, partial [Candidatus Velamenicoccus archaeovorus]